MNESNREQPMEEEVRNDNGEHVEERMKLPTCLCLEMKILIAK